MDHHDPLTTMLAFDIEVCKVKVDNRVVQALKIHLKYLKEKQLSAGVVIYVFTTNNFMCPDMAFNDWSKDKVVRLTNQKPMFHLDEGKNYTRAMFNNDIKQILKE